MLFNQSISSGNEPLRRSASAQFTPSGIPVRGTIRCSGASKQKWDIYAAGLVTDFYGAINSDLFIRLFFILPAKVNDIFAASHKPALHLPLSVPGA